MKAARNKQLKNRSFSRDILAVLSICALLALISVLMTSTVFASVESSGAQINSSDSADIEIEKWDFGVVTNRIGPTKDWHLHPIVVVPNLPGVQYAWKLKTNRKSPVFVKEEFLLPEAPSMWKVKGGGGSSQLLNGGEGCLLESFQPTDDGWLGHAWTISAGDPAGRYQIKIWLNGKLAHTFIFNVGDAPRIGREIRTY